MQRETLKHIKGNDLRVYADLLTYADKYGKCFPAVETIAIDIDITERNVQKHLSNLETAGWIDRNYRTNTSTMYQLYYVDTSGTSGKTAKYKKSGTSRTDVAGVSKSDRSGVSKNDVSGVSESDVLTDQLTNHTTDHSNNAVVVPVVKKTKELSDGKYKLTSEERTQFRQLWNDNSQDGESKLSAQSAWTRYCSLKDADLLRRIENWLEPETGTYMTSQMKQISEEYFEEKEKKKQKAKLKAEGKERSL